MNKVCVRTLLMTPEMTWHSGGLMPCLAFCIIPFARSVIKNENKIRLHILPHVSILEGRITQFCEVVTLLSPCFYDTYFLSVLFIPPLPPFLCVCVCVCVCVCACACV